VVRPMEKRASREELIYPLMNCSRYTPNASCMIRSQFNHVHIHLPHQDATVDLVECSPHQDSGEQRPCALYANALDTHSLHHGVSKRSSTCECQTDLERLFVNGNRAAT
jgi:hypothetical protein